MGGWVGGGCVLVVPELQHSPHPWPGLAWPYPTACLSVCSHILPLCFIRIPLFGESVPVCACVLAACPLSAPPLLPWAMCCIYIPTPTSVAVSLSIAAAAPTPATPSFMFPTPCRALTRHLPPPPSSSISHPITRVGPCGSVLVVHGRPLEATCPMNFF